MHLDLWTLALQTINVLVLVWLLAHFLFRPVAAIIAERRAAANALLAEAEAQRAKAAAEAQALADQRRALAGDGERIAAAARTAAEAERAAVLRSAEAAVTKLRTDALQAMNHDRLQQREAMEHDAADLGVTIAKRLLERLPAQALNRAFLEGLAEALATHPSRQTLLDSAIEWHSAVPLDAALQADIRAMLTRLLGAAPELSFHTDPDLIAGFELVSSHAVIGNSWRADLERITNVLHRANDVAAQHVA